MLPDNFNAADKAVWSAPDFTCKSIGALIVMNINLTSNDLLSAEFRESSKERKKTKNRVAK